MRRIAGWLTAIIDIQDVFFFGGLIMLAYGVEHIESGAGFALAGLLIVLYVRPLGRWLK